MLGLAIYKERSEAAAKGRGSASTPLLLAPCRTSFREGPKPATEFPGTPYTGSRVSEEFSFSVTGGRAALQEAFSGAAPSAVKYVIAGSLKT